MRIKKRYLDNICNHELEDIKKYLDDKVCIYAANCHYWAFIGSRDCVKMVGQTCPFVLIFTSHINFAHLLQQPLPAFMFHCFLLRVCKEQGEMMIMMLRDGCSHQNGWFLRKVRKGPPPTFFGILTFCFPISCSKSPV